MSSSGTLSATSQTSSSSVFSRTSRGSPKSSAEGRSQTHWKLFRKEVLAPHHIRVLDTVAADQLPDAVVGWINANRDNVSRFTRQRKDFRRQVAQGRGFGDSALFPHEVLPWSRGQPFIANCMVPSYSAESLPKRMIHDPTGKLSLTPPRPGFACGFSSAAFGPEELKSIPDFLTTSGTTLQFDTGSITPDSALYCPFITFERTFCQQKYGLEIAANQCAINGAWCVRSLQMLHNKANGDSRDSAFEDPVSFTCAIDNQVAIINYHWLDHARTYCMAPVVKFELSRDDHFDQFLIWIEAIGQWAVSFVLPEVKKAICLITEDFSQELALIEPVKFSQNTTAHEEQRLFSALKLSYENVPWRLDSDNASAVSSSTASWGSPVVNEAIFSQIKYPMYLAPSLPMQTPSFTRIPPRPGSACSEPIVSKTVRDVPRRERTGMTLKPALDTSLAPWGRLALPELPSSLVQKAPQPSFDMHSDLVVSKRLGHAMDEIKDLQQQMTTMKQELSGSTMCLQNELSGLRKSMTTVLRKERLSFKQGSGVRSVSPDGNGMVQLERQSISFKKDVSIVTTPTDPTARPVWPRSSSAGTTPRQPSGLQNMLTLDTKVSTSFSTTHESACGSADNCKSPNITIYSPTVINVTTNNGTEEVVEDEENDRALIRVPGSRQNNWSPVLASHVLCALVPSAMLRVIFLGLILDYCMVSIGGSQVPSFSHYMSNILDGTIAV